MNTKSNFTVEGALEITSLPVVSNTLSTLMEQDGKVVRRTLGTISTLSKESYLPGFSVSLPSILNTNTNSVDYNSRELVISLANQMQGTAFLAPSNMNGTPAFRKIVKSDLNLASVIFDDDSRLHTHPNKSVLDGITSTKVSNWDTAFGWGNFRDYGLGKFLNNDINDGNVRPEWNGFVGPYGSSAVNIPDKFSPMLALRRGDFSGYIQLNRFGEIHFQTWMSASSSESGWKKVWHDGNLSKLSQLDNDLTLNYITSNSNETSLSGNKTTSGIWNFKGSAATPLIIDKSAPNNINIRYSSTTSNVYAGIGDSNVFAVGGSPDLMNSANPWMQVTDNGIKVKGGIGGTTITSRDIGSIYVETTTNSNKAESILLHNWKTNNTTFTIGGVSSPVSGSMITWGMYRFLNDRTTNGNDGFFGWVGNTDQLMASSLAGTGNRMVIATSGGYLNTMELPTDTTYTAGNGLALSNTNVFSVTGGNGLVANTSGLSLGTPSSVTLSSTNNLTSTSHTHAFTPGGTASQYIDGTGKLVTFPNIPDGELFVNKNGDTMSNTLSISKHTSDGFPNDIVSNANNYINQAIFKTITGNNAITIFGDSVYNRRRMAIQSSHATSSYSNVYGILELNPFGGDVNVNGDKVASEKWVNSQGFVTTDTKYTAGAGLTLTGTTFSLPVTQSGSGNYVSSVVQSTGGLTVTKATLPIPALVTSTSATGTTNVATTNTNTYLNVVSGGVATGSSTKITGAGSVTVASNTAGQLTITGTNTTYSTGTLQQLQTGTDTVGRLQTSKNLNDWFDSKYVPTTQVFEKTPQGGLKVKDWDGLANKLGAISIGQGAQATKINSLALVSGSSADGNSSIAIGLNAQSLAIRGISVAPNSTNNAPDSAIMGVGLLNNQKGCTVIGNYNNPIKQEVNVEVDETSPIFIIGNGKDSMLKSNSLEHFADGSTRYFGRQYYNRDTRQESWFEDANTLVDVQYIRDNGAGMTPNPSSLAVYGFSGDILEGQSSYATKSGEFVYFDSNGIWQRVAIGGSSLNSQKHGVTFGIWLMDGRVLLRGYYRSDAPGSAQDRGKAYYYKAQNTNQAPQLVAPSSIGRDDIFLGTVITNTSIIFFNPR